MTRYALRALIGTGLACFSLFAATPAFAKGTRIVVTAQARAIIVTQLSFIKVNDINFGRIIAGTTAGTVVVAPNGARTKTGGVILASGGGEQPASFAGKGSFNQSVTIAMSANTVTLTRVGGTQTMTMDTFIIGSTPTATLTTTPLAFRIGSVTGLFNFPLGATLHVKANQTAGTYRGTFSVTLQYQ